MHALLPSALATFPPTLPGVEGAVVDMAQRQAAPPPVMVSGTVQTPIVLASPHSGRFYPERFVQASRQPLAVLRSGEDSYIDLLAQPANALGPTLVQATFPRVFCDPNRAAWDLDTRMFHGTIPSFVRPTERGLAGLGSIPRMTGNQRPIYRARLPFSEAALRIRNYWMPYHTTLADLLDQTRRRYGLCLLLDLHSMPDMPDNETADFVLGDRHGAACANTFVETAERIVQGLGYSTARNTPYAGGYITQHYGRPHDGRTPQHALQIEIRRSLYMDEATHAPHAGFGRLADAIARLVEALLDDFSAHRR
ncbi:N-formylglutamate amidohydrolase [Acetobacter garciniae]|nr:N-formylglutamate amidohydrolase [Acetobacter garciniae]